MIDLVAPFIMFAPIWVFFKYVANELQNCPKFKKIIIDYLALSFEKKSIMETPNVNVSHNFV